MEFVPWPPNDDSVAIEGSSSTSTEVAKISQKDQATGIYPYVEDLSRFEASLRGLANARKAIRRQMMRIVNEVDLIEKDPKLATDEDHQEPFQSPVTFESRLPAVQVPESLRPKSDPLTGKRIMAKTQTEEEQKEELAAQESAANAPYLYVTSPGGDDLTEEEKQGLEKLKQDHPGIGKHLRVSSAIGERQKGVPFTNLDFLQPDWEVQAIRVEVARGAIAYIEVEYENGLVLRKGQVRFSFIATKTSFLDIHVDYANTYFKTAGGLVKELKSFLPGERVTFASLESGEPSTGGNTRVLAVRLYTNHGRRLLAQAAKNEVGQNGTITKDGIQYEKVTSIYVDAPLPKATFRGFFGRCDDSGDKGLVRLGLIWGDLYKAPSATNSEGVGSSSSFDYGAQSDTDEVQTLKNELAQKERTLQDALRGKKTVTIAQAGRSEPSQWNPDKSNMLDLTLVKFSNPYLVAPRMMSGITRLDQKASQAIQTKMTHQDVTATGFNLLTETFGTPSYGSAAGWMALPENDVHIETGIYDTYGVPRFSENQTSRGRVAFSRRFDRAPTVWTWIYELNMPRGWHSLGTEVTGMNEDRFDFCVRTWECRSFTGVRIGWVAFDAGRNDRVKSGTIVARRGTCLLTGRVTFDSTSFSKTPAVFMALKKIDAGDDKNLRLDGKVTNVSPAGFDYSCGTWASSDDHNMDHAEWVWIAIE